MKLAKCIDFNPITIKEKKNYNVGTAPRCFSSQNGDLGYFCSHLGSFYWAIIYGPADVSISKV